MQFPEQQASLRQAIWEAGAPTWLVPNSFKNRVQWSIWGRGAGCVAKVPDACVDANLVGEVEPTAIVLQCQQAVDAALCEPVQPADPSKLSIQKAS